MINLEIVKDLYQNRLLVDMSRTNVLIVGAGPVGLTMANELQKWGIPFRIIDSKTFPEPYTKASNLWPRTQETLATLGVWETMYEQSLIFKRFVFYAYGKEVGVQELTGYKSPYPMPLQTGQNRIEKILWENLAKNGSTVEGGKSLISLSQQENYVEAIVENEQGIKETIESTYVIGCDGRKGAVRKSIGLDIQKVTSFEGRSMWQGDIKLAWSRPVDEETMWFFNLDKGYICILPISKGYHRIWLVYDTNILPDRNPTAEELESVLREFTGDPSARVTQPAWLSYQRQFSTGVVKHLQKGNVFLAGDAGHLSIPIGGQGMNTGIQDTFNLGWKIAGALKGYTKAVVLDSYSVERQKVREELMEDQIKGFNDTMYPGEIREFLLKNIAPVVMKASGSFKGLIEGLRRDEAMLDIEYANSPLNKQVSNCSGLNVGGRVPDATIVLKRNNDHINTTLFQLIYPSVKQTNTVGPLPLWTLLLFEGIKTDEEIRKELLSITQMMSSKYKLINALPVLNSPSSYELSELVDVDKIAYSACEIKTEALLLIRPDGHLAFKGHPNNRNELDYYCSLIFEK